MRAPVTSSRTLFMRRLTNRHSLLIVAIVGLIVFFVGQELKLLRPAKAAFFATRFVANTGSDTTDCTNAGAPCATITYAIGQAVASDTIQVAAGTYNEPQILIDKSVSVLGAGAATTTINGGNTPIGTVGMVRINLPGTDTGNVIFSGFTLMNPGLTGGSRYHIFAKAISPLSTITISNNKITGVNMSDYGLYSDRTLGKVIFDHNELTNNAFNPILIERPQAETDVHHNTISGNGSTAYFNFTYSGNDVTAKQRVADNTINGSTASAISINGASPIGGGLGKYTNVEITNNVITQLGTNRLGISLSNGASTGNGPAGAIENPVISGNSITGTDLAGSKGIRFLGLITNAAITSNNVRDVDRAFSGEVNNSHSATGTQAHFNNFVSNPNGFIWDGPAAVNAENNWWGCNFGPGMGGTGCAGTANGLGGTGVLNIDANPWLVLGITAMPNSINVGGMSNLTANLTINSDSVDTSGSGNIPNGTPVAFAGVNGMVSPSNTTTTSGKANSTFTGTTPGAGSASTTVDGQTVSTPISITGPPTVYTSRLSDPIVCLGPGSNVTGTIQLNNPNGTALTFTLNTTLTNLVGVAGSCTLTGAVGGTCNVNGGTLMASGSIPANGTLTVQYLAQVAQVPSGTTVTASSSATLGGQTAQPDPLVVSQTVNCPVVGPGTPPAAAVAVSDQKPGSVLFYNIYTSNPANLTSQNTRINITNTDPGRSVVVHLFFVDGATCTPADAFICLTPNQTQSFTAGDIDPGTTGYIVAVAVDSATGCPINFNFLIGDEFVKLASGHQSNLAAESFAALTGTPPLCAPGATTATLDFNGVSYNQVPRMLAVDNFPSPADGNNTLVILNRVGGNLATGANTIGSLFGVLYDESEQLFSFSLASSNCQFRFSLTNSSLRIVQRLESVIGPGRTGWLRLWGVSDIGLLGSVINFNGTAGVNNFNQGHNLHKLTFTTASLTIPIFIPNC